MVFLFMSFGSCVSLGSRDLPVEFIVLFLVHVTCYGFKQTMKMSGNEIMKIK